MNKKNELDINKINATTIDHDDYINKKLQDPEYQKGWLTVTIQDYINTGDYNEFYRALEQVIKARGSVSAFAKQVGINRSNLVDLLHGKTKTTPNLTTITKILNGLGYTLAVEKLA